MAVTNLDRLLNYRDKVEGVRIQSQWCHTCLHGFRKRPAFERHIGLCRKNVERTTLYSMPENKYIEFKDWSKTIKQQFVVYADFESILPLDDKHFQKHEPIASEFVLLHQGCPIRNETFVGKDCIIQFIQALDDIATDIVYPWYKINGSKEMMELTWEQQEEFTNQTHCYLCKKIINIPVRDHDHFTGQYLGAACQDCNLARRINPSLPVVFHNLRGYDIHHILKYAIGKFPDWNLIVIPQSTEKFLTLTATSKGRRIRFIDSLQFLNSSLANLSKNLPCLPPTSDVFESQMMTCKSIFPCDMVTSMDV
mgnify:FL=1